MRVANLILDGCAWFFFLVWFPATGIYAAEKNRRERKRHWPGNCTGESEVR